MINRIAKMWNLLNSLPCQIPIYLRSGEASSKFIYPFKH